jgi:hypothetical protein
MKTIAKIVFVATALGISAPIMLTTTLAQTTASAVSTAPSEVVDRFVKALNGNDAKAIKAAFAANAWTAYGENGARKTGDALMAWLESDIIRVKGKLEVQSKTLNGNAVTVTGRYSSTGWSGNAKYIFTVQNGLIASWLLL